MSKELNFADGYDEVKYLDNSTNFDLILTENNIAFDLSRADAISIKIGNDDGYIMEKDIDPKTITNYQSGEIIFPIDDSIMNTLVPDDYYIEVWLKVNPVSIETDSESATFTVDNDSLEERQSIFPSTGLLGFTIDKNINSETGEVIPTITFDQFQSQFNDMMAQMDNVVHNIQKGDKGDKGDTGQGLDIKDKVSNISNLPSTSNEGDGYLVGEELYVWINGAWKDCGTIQGPQGIQGIQGPKGDTGNGVSSTTIQYQISNSATNTPTGTWSNDIIATTQDNPYLWLQATLNYTDGTKKIFYLVSTKGDKGDKGDQGIQGVQGPKGDTGAGLQVKGKVNNVSQLPTTGQDGYCYFVGTDMYVWTNGKWNDMGNISPDLSNYVTLTDMNNGLATKVTDNKDGTEQLNGVQVQPFNKLNDTISTRNYALGTLNSTSMKSNGEVGTTIQNFPLSDRLANLSANTPIHYSYDLLVTGADGGINWAGWGNPWQPFVQGQVISSDGTHHFEGNTTLPSNEIITGNTFHSTIDNSSATYQIENLIITVGDTHVDYLPAPEDKADDSKVVHTADMRKPASDVAGIEEVNAKQDKIGYTPADDSKVLHSTLTQLNSTDMDTVLTAGFYQSISGTNGIPSGDNWTIYQVIPLSSLNGVQVAYETNNAILGMRSWNNNPGHTNFTSWVQFADNSKVAHLSGANNFDTVPTVNNNPLLLASSLPSDLARTGSNQEFTGKNTFDTAPIDKTTGNPYITKDGVPAVPSTLADTNKDANFTGKLQKSGIDVATTTDVKNAVNTAVSPLNINTNWVSLSVDSSQIKDTDWDSTVTNCNYRIAHSTLYLTGKYRMLATSNNKSGILFQLPTNIVSQISFPSTNEFQIGIIQAIARVPIMFMISLTNDGKISTTTSPYDMNSSNFGAQYGLGLINAAIPLN